MFAELAKTEQRLELLEPVLFYQNVSTSKDLRDASNQAETIVRNFAVDVEMRVDVFKAKKNAEANIKAQGVQLSPEEKRLVEKMMLDGKRAGLDLPEDKRNLLIEKKKELSNLCVEFSVCIIYNRMDLADTSRYRKTSTRKQYVALFCCLVACLPGGA